MRDSKMLLTAGCPLLATCSPSAQTGGTQTIAAPTAVAATSTPTATWTATLKATPAQVFTPVSTDTPAPPATITLIPKPASITFKIDDTVAPDERDLIEKVVLQANQFFGEAGPVTLYASDNFDALF